MLVVSTPAWMFEFVQVGTALLLRQWCIYIIEEDCEHAHAAGNALSFSFSLIKQDKKSR